MWFWWSHENCQRMLQFYPNDQPTSYHIIRKKLTLEQKISYKTLSLNFSHLNKKHYIEIKILPLLIWSLVFSIQNQRPSVINSFLTNPLKATKSPQIFQQRFKELIEKNTKDEPYLYWRFEKRNEREIRSCNQKLYWIGITAESQLNIYLRNTSYKLSDQRGSTISRRNFCFFTGSRSYLKVLQKRIPMH